MRSTAILLAVLVLAACNRKPPEANEAWPGLVPVELRFIDGIEACLTPALQADLRRHKVPRISAAERPCSTAEQFKAMSRDCRRPVTTYEVVRSPTQRDRYTIEGWLLDGVPVQVIEGASGDILLSLSPTRLPEGDQAAVCKNVAAAVKRKVLARF